MLQYQIIDTILESVLQKYNNYNDFKTVEGIQFFQPFSWNHIYVFSNVSHFTWNIIVPKMYRFLLKNLNDPLAKESIIIFDGPDFISNQLDNNTEGIFTASSFQVFIMCLNYQLEHFKMIFTNNLLKDKVKGHHNIHKISEEITQ